MSPGKSVDLNLEDVEIIGQPKSPINHDQLRKIEAWLEPTDYLNEFSELYRHIASRAPGTGIWICDTPQYQQSHNTDDHGSLWVKRVPGAGKSIISACLVQHLKATENSPVLSFFFRNIIKLNRKSQNLVCDWLAQLLRYSVDLQVALKAIVDVKLDDSSDEQLWDYLLLGLSSVEKVYCIVDALGEMNIGEEKDFLQRLNNLAVFRPQMKDASIVHISLEDARVGKDINLFVSQPLGNIFEGRNPDLKLSLHSIISDRSAGIFLYARLLLDSLMSARVSKQRLDFEEIASTLPVGMQEMYNIFILNAVVFSSRLLLLLNEIADLLAFVYPSYNLPSAKTIVKSACGSLLEIMDDETVQTYHGNHYDIEDKYVFDAVSEFSNPESVDFIRWLTLEWGIRFITKDSVVPSPAHVAALSGHRAILDDEDDSHLRPIHEAARRGFSPIVLALLEAGVNLTRSTDDNTRHDSEVCVRNREAESGTALDYICVYTGTAMLYAATMGGNPSCVEQVLIRDADPNAFSEPRLLDRRQHSAKPQDRKYFQSTALHILAESGYEANLEANNSNGRTPLWLCFTSRTTVTKLVIRCFLNAGSNATMKDEKGHGAIYNVLARTKDVELLKLLIHHGADVSAISTDGESCLEALFAYGFTTRDTDSFDNTIQFLVKNGARCDVQPVKRLSIIERVANSKNYSIETFKILLQYCTYKEAKRRCLFLLDKDTKEGMMKFDEEVLLSGVSLEESEEKDRTALIQED
ncbi:hypothetical protein BHYA_0123g00120 [Botrytis hyacinthi]|uniref:Nephrocystin 3-like N-terminal domain-containing protein n=1 Tax=Botrytis hyacinthi TaxID=278943 RepID=A0A4Z1GHU0_9HELO|nr:hypothetical protein BHYA_0123g00120 [Botrytis hyacinthi]